MKKLTRLALVGLCVLLALSFSGCSLVTVNPEKDNKTVIATIDGKDVLKSEYNNYLAMMTMSYEGAGQTMPTGSDLKTMKENLYESLVQAITYADEAKKEKLTVDEAAAKKQGKEQAASLKKTLGDEKYATILSDNYTTADAFEQWMQDYQVTSAYASKVSDAFSAKLEKDPTEALSKVVGKINDTDVTYGEYQYRLVGKALEYYMSNQTSLPTDEKSVKERNKEIFADIEKTNANIQYAKDNNIEITEADITAAQKTLASTFSYFFQDDDQTNQFLQSYYLNKTLFDKYQKQEAKGKAAETAIQAKLTDEVKVTDSQIETYYKENSKKYDTSTVSAMHILTQDQDTANAIYAEAKGITNKADFQKLMDKYKGTENVSEATDLGAFTYSKMVQEFSKAAFAADKNTVTGPVSTQYGYHIIYVYDKKDGEVTPLEDVKASIEKTLKEQQGEKDFTAFEEKLVKGAKYDIYDIKTPVEDYTDQLEKDFDVKKYENRIRA